MANYLLNCNNLSMRDSKFVEQIAQYLGERLDKSDISIKGTTISVSLSENQSKGKIKQVATKFLYQSGLKKEYRFIQLLNSDDGEGYIIMKR